MKNIKRLLVATIALVSASSMANLAQPHVATTEEAPVRITAGLQGGLLMTPKAAGVEPGFGANNLGLGLGAIYNFGYDFEAGLAVGGNWATPEDLRVFTKAAEKAQGVRLEVELLARFMPELAEGFRLGGLLSVGYSTQFGGEALKEDKKKVAFGDMSARAGIPLSYGFSDMVTVYFAPSFALTAIRFANSDVVKGDEATKSFKEYANLPGIDAPLGLWVSVADNVGVYLEANTRFRNFKKFGQSWKEDVTLGFSFAM